jgi:hypothetical protein
MQMQSPRRDERRRRPRRKPTGQLRLTSPSASLCWPCLIASADLLPRSVGINLAASIDAPPTARNSRRVPGLPLGDERNGHHRRAPDGSVRLPQWTLGRARTASEWRRVLCQMRSQMRGPVESARLLSRASLLAPGTRLTCCRCVDQGG